MAIVDSIKSGTFGNDFKGSPLELVLASITEQKQVFEGAVARTVSLIDVIWVSRDLKRIECAFQTSTCIGLRYLLFSDLEQHCHGLCKFGDDYRILFKLAKDAGCSSR